VIGWVWLAACTCASPPAPPSAAPDPGHFGTFPALVDQVLRVDREGSRREARDLLADADTVDDVGVEAVGGAVGFLQVADDDELVDGLVALAHACGACHDGVPAPPAPVNDHRRAGQVAAWALVWGQPMPTPAPQQLGPAYALGPEGALRSCESCHPGGYGLRP